MIKTYNILNAIFRYLIIVCDRLIMSPFIGVKLPTLIEGSMNIDETTTDDQIEQSIQREENHQYFYHYEYMPKAKKRVIIGFIIVLLSWVFIMISWITILILLSIAVLSVGIIIFWKRYKK